MFHLDRKTVRKMLSFSVPPGYRRSAPPRRPNPSAKDNSSPVNTFRMNGPDPACYLQKLRDNEWEEEPISKTWAQFIPDIAKDEKETYRYPMPMSDEFWGLYAEPVDAFFNGANALWRTIQDLIHIKPIATATTEDAVSVRRGVKTLNALVAPVATLSMN